MYLQFLAILVINRHGHLNILGCGLVPLVKITLNQSHIDVISHITFRKKERNVRKILTLYFSTSPRFMH